MAYISSDVLKPINSPFQAVFIGLLNDTFSATWVTWCRMIGSLRRMNEQFPPYFSTCPREQGNRNKRRNEGGWNWVELALSSNSVSLQFSYVRLQVSKAVSV
jgi:hypothetical protein